MYITYSISENVSYKLLIESLEKLRPDYKIDGSWRYNCCDAICTDMNQINASLIAYDNRTVCPHCISGYEILEGTKVKQNFVVLEDGLVREEYNKIVRFKSVDEMKTVIASDFPQCNLREKKKSSYLIWSEQDKFDCCCNIVSSLFNDDNEGVLWKRKDFSHLEMSFLKEYNLLEYYYELSIIVNIQHRKQTDTILREIANKMHNAGVNLVF